MCARKRESGMEQLDPEKAGVRRGDAVHRAMVVDVGDPEGLGRVLVHMPALPDSPEVWARLATLMAGDESGSWFVPEVGDEVLVVLEGGDPRWPHVVGALWNEGRRPPEQMDGGGENNIKSLSTRSGVKITFDDSNGSEKLKLETPAGQVVELDDGAQKVIIEDVHGNRLRLDASGVSVETYGTAKVAASKVEIAASLVTVDAAMTTFSGVVKCETMQATSVIASTYTPGAGNVV